MLALFLLINSGKYLDQGSKQADKEEGGESLVPIGIPLTL